MLADGFDPSALIAGDDFFATVRKGFIAPWTEAAHHQNETVVAAAAAAAGRMVQGGYTVVYDGVIGPWFLEAFVRTTGLPEVHYVMLLPPEDVCLQRISSRQGHGFRDLAAARHMYREFAAAAASSLRVLTSSSPPESVAAEITALFNRGELRVPTKP
jgi:chloramphenicol 3-O-phosphotransferase